MSGFKDDFNERLDAAAKAKQAMLEKFRARRPAAPTADAPDAAAPEPKADAGEAGGKAGRKSGRTPK
jgi:Family of unknown function (DUF6481)